MGHPAADQGLLLGRGPSVAECGDHLLCLHGSLEGVDNGEASLLESTRFRVTTVRPWTRAVAAMRLSLMGMARPAVRRPASSCAHLKPVSASHGKQRSLRTPASNHRSSLVRLLPLRSKGMPKRCSPRMIGSTAISRSLSRSHSTTLALGSFLVGSLRTLTSTSTRYLTTR